MRFAKVYLEITNQCNRRCAFCPGTGRSPGFLSIEQFEQLLRKLRGYTKFLYFHLMGEPLLHPDLAAFLDMAGQFGFRVILTTNGTLLEKRSTELLRADALHKVNVSLHSFEADARGVFEAYVSACLSFAKQAAATGILVNLRLWNLDAAHLRGLNERNDEIMRMLQTVFPAPWSLARGGQKLTDRVYLSRSERFAWPSLTAPDLGESRFCYGLKDQIGVLCDGTVVPCCLDHEGDLALGNLFTEDLAEILEKPRSQAILRGFQRNKAVEELCRRCGFSTRFSPEEKPVSG